MEDRKTELIAEISQLFEQYRKEVPGRRRAWPESIKLRVSELRKLGVNFRQISIRTKVPYFTVLKWQCEGDATPQGDSPKLPGVRWGSRFH